MSTVREPEHQSSASASSVRLRAASPGDAAALSDIAWRSKAHWGYDDSFMQACRDELGVDPAQLCARDQIWRLAEVDGRIAGFVGISRPVGHTADIEALFVDPDYMRRGLGQRLLEAAIDNAQAGGIRYLTVQSDPHAAGFYRKFGAVQTGSSPSGSVPGRMLPEFQIALDVESAR